MEDLIGLIIVLVIGGLSTVGKAMMQGQKPGSPREGRPRWPGPIAGPGLPRQGSPRPTQPGTRRRIEPVPGAPSPWPQPERAEQAPPSGRPQVGQYEQAPPSPWASPAEGSPAEGPSPSTWSRRDDQRPRFQADMGWGSLGSSSTEGTSSEGRGSLAEERARFQEEREQFRRLRPESTLHRSQEVDSAEAQGESPVAALLKSREGLAQAVLLTEVLGKPRALRPYGRR